MKCIVYKGGYKYQLKRGYRVQITLRPAQPIDTEYIKLDAAGNLSLKEGYAWDGPSGPTVDTLNFMRGSLVHDALYQLMRERHLDHGKHKEPADRLLQKICREDGMTAIRAWEVYQGVHLFGSPAADPAHDRPLTKAPKACG